MSETENKLQWRAVYPESPGVVKTRKGYVFTACIEAEKEVSLLFYKKGESRPEIAVPLSKEKRPEWDRNNLSKFGFNIIRIDENINQRVFNEEEQVRYSATPMFTVVVEKKLN